MDPPRSLRVLHVHRSSGIGGSERHLIDLASEQVGRGHAVRVVVPADRAPQPLVRRLRDRGVDASVVGHRVDLSPRLALKLARVIRGFEPDVVHTHLIHADLHGQLAARACGVVGVSSVHSAHEFYRRFPYRPAARFAARLAARTIAISSFAARYLVEHGVVAEHRVRTVPYGIDPAEWDPARFDRWECRRRLGWSDDQVVVGVASRLIPGKGHRELVEAVASVRARHPEVVLSVFGDGPERGSLATAAAETLGDAVRFHGFVDDMAPAMAGCDVLAFLTRPELREGFGLAALEGMALGVPVVATDVASLPEVVEHGETGLLVAPGDHEALVDALAELAGSEARRAALGRNGAARARREFSLEAMVDRIETVYDEALAERRRSR